VWGARPNAAGNWRASATHAPGVVVTWTVSVRGFLATVRVSWGVAVAVVGGTVAAVPPASCTSAFPMVSTTARLWDDPTDSDRWRANRFATKDQPRMFTTLTPLLVSVSVSVVTRVPVSTRVSVTGSSKTYSDTTTRCAPSPYM